MKYDRVNSRLFYEQLRSGNVIAGTLKDVPTDECVRTISESVMADCARKGMIFDLGKLDRETFLAAAHTGIDMVQAGMVRMPFSHFMVTFEGVVSYHPLPQRYTIFCAEVTDDDWLLMGFSHFKEGFFIANQSQFSPEKGRILNIHGQQDFGDYSTSLLYACLSLICTKGVKWETVEPKSKPGKLFRVGRHKPSPEYFAALRSGERRERGVSTGTRPRPHLRRGHIRTLPSGDVWVNACLVNVASEDELPFLSRKAYRI